MEEVVIRFPHLGEKIFDQLDYQNLTKCKEVSRSLRKFLEENKLLWKRMIIEKYSANNVEFKDAWKLVTEKVPTQIVKELALAVEKFYSFCPHRLESQHSPHHIAADHGSLSLYKFIAQKTKVVSPERSNGLTGLHSAARELKRLKYSLALYQRQLSALQTMEMPLLNGTAHVNPDSLYGWTPLHMAAHKGHFKVFEYIAEHVSDLNVQTSDGSTPLHLAASEGHFEIVRYIVGIVNDKNPVNAEGNTPLHETAKKGHLEIYKCIADQVDKKNPIYKNPVNNEGTTPLHEAARKGHIGICKLILDYGVDPHVKNNAMHSALDLASTKEFRDLIRKKSKKIELSKKRKLDESKENIVLI